MSQADNSMFTCSYICIVYTSRLSNTLHNLGIRVHDRVLPDRLSRLADCNFIVRMLIDDAYSQHSVYLCAIRPPDIICRWSFVLPGILSFFLSFFLFFLSFFVTYLLSFFLLSSFFRRLISEPDEPNSTKIGHIVGSKCNLKTHVRHLGYP